MNKIQNNNSLRNNEARMICVDGEAIYEFIREKFHDDASTLFDLKKADSNGTDYFLQMKWNKRKQQFVCIALPDSYLGKSINIDHFEESIVITSNTLYTASPYKTINLDDYSQNRTNEKRCE